MNVDKFLRAIENSRDYAGQLIHVNRLQARSAIYSDPSEPLHPHISLALRSLNIERLYSHQAGAIDAVRRGENVLVVTSTASGKTLCYNIPILETLLQEPQSRILYLYPTKALAQDQLRGILRIKEANPNLNFIAGTYDGDTPPPARKKLRDYGNLILSNPDMLHAGILPHHSRWGEFFANLKFVVIDEIHTYRGIFGSNVANVIRRLNRICAHHGSNPQFICASATIGNPQELAEKLTNRSMTLINNDGSPKGPKSFILWNPPFIDIGLAQRRSSNSEAVYIMTRLIRDHISTITFVQARILAELVFRYCQEQLRQIQPSLAKLIKPYRGGYLPEERREIERQLFSGELLGITSTSALELGIDVGNLDAAILVGYPGTIASVWQQAGRAGRREDEALAIFIGKDNPIDQYLMQHPDYFFGQNPESAVIDPENPYVLLGHLRCAANELPIRYDELSNFGEHAGALLQLLAEEKHVTLVKNKWYWSGRGYPAADVNLRNISKDTYTIVDVTNGSGEVIGTVDEFGAFMLVHPQAIYLHQGETYFVRDLNLTQKIAYIEKIDCDYYTHALTDDQIRVDAAETETDWKQNKLCYGQVTVTTSVIMFRKIKFYSLDSIGFGNLDLPPQELETEAFWLIPPLEALRQVREHGRIPQEGMLGLANLMPAVIPLFVICDFMDIGSLVDSSNTGVPTIFVYDKYPGGLGFAQKAHDKIEEILTACLELIKQCPCENGCPSCVGSTGRTWSSYEAITETVERIPDKEAAIVILHAMLGLEPYVPKPLDEERREQDLPPPPKIEIKPLPENVELKIRKKLQRFKERRQ